MKYKLFKRFSALLIALCLIVSVINISSKDKKVLAADVDVSISLSSSYISIGDYVTATFSVSGSSISAGTLYVGYDSSVLSYESGTGMIYGGGGSLTISFTGEGSASATFRAEANGEASIYTSGEDFYDIEGSALGVSHAGVTVTVRTEEQTTSAPSNNDDPEPSNNNTEENTDKRSNNCYLSSLIVNPGELKPAFSSSTTDYTVDVPEDTKSITVSAETDDSKAYTSISGADDLKKGQNTVCVTVTAENGAVKNYYITVNCGKVTEYTDVTIDGKKYKFIQEDFQNVPEGFKEKQIKYKDGELKGYTSAGGNIDIIYLADEAGNKSWYIYDGAKDKFFKYFEYSSAYKRYIIIEKPENVTLPEGFKATTVDLGQGNVPAFVDDSDSGIYLVYAVDVDGKEGFYYYDTVEKSFMRYINREKKEPEVATASSAEPTPLYEKEEKPEYEGIFTRENLIKIVIGVTALFVIMCIVAIIFMIKNAKLSNEIAGFDEEEDELSKVAEEDDEEEEAPKSKGLSKTEDTSKAENVSLNKSEDVKIKEDADIAKTVDAAEVTDTAEITAENIAEDTVENDAESTVDNDAESTVDNLSEKSSPVSDFIAELHQDDAAESNAKTDDTANDVIADMEDAINSSDDSVPQFEVEAPKFDFEPVSKATESGNSLVEEETKKASQDIESKIGIPEANINGDTGSIVLEEALDNNSGVHVDYQVEEESFEEKLRREAAEKDHGLDSAFDFMNEDK